MQSHIKHSESGDTFRIMFDSLVRWRNMQECRGEQAGPLLDDLLECFRKESIALTEATDENKTLMSKSDSSKSKDTIQSLHATHNKQVFQSLLHECVCVILMVAFSFNCNLKLPSVSLNIRFMMMDISKKVDFFNVTG